MPTADVEYDQRSMMEAPSRPHARAGGWAIIALTWRKMGKDNVSALSAAAAFYALTSIFPTLTALVSIYGLVADPGMAERQGHPQDLASACWSAFCSHHGACGRRP